MKIDWNGLDRRVTRLAATSGNISMVLPSPDGRTYLFQAGGGAAAAPGAAAAAPGMYTMNEDGTGITHLNTTPTDAAAAGRGRGGRGGAGGFGGGAEPTWARDGRSIYFMQGGSLYTLAIGGGGGGHKHGRGAVNGGTGWKRRPRRGRYPRGYRGG